MMPVNKLFYRTLRTFDSSKIIETKPKPVNTAGTALVSKPKKLLEHAGTEFVEASAMPFELNTTPFALRKSTALGSGINILFHDKCHRKDMDAPEIEAFLTHLLEKNGQVA